MHPTSLRSFFQALSEQSAALVIALLASNLLFNILANSSFKASAASPTWRDFLAWQIIGNLCGFITVLTLTWLLRFLPLSIVFPVTTGLAVIGVEVASTRIFFNEPVTSVQWLGTLLITVGILLIGRK